MGLFLLAVAGAIWGWRSSAMGWAAVLKVALAAICITILNLVLRSAIMGIPYPALRGFVLVLSVTYLCIALPFGAAAFIKRRRSEAGN